jgi:tetratricopeptide (TPR) repeat protein
LSELIEIAEKFLLLLKEFLTSHLGSLPLVGGFISDSPLWVYAIAAGVFLMSAMFTGFEILTHLKNRTMEKVQGSKFGVAKEKRRLMNEAARLARKKNHARASELYLSIGEYTLAAEVLEKGDLLAKAGQLYERSGQLEKAISLYEQAGELGWLAEALKKRGEEQRAAEIYLKLGKRLLAAESFEKAGIHDRAASLFEEAGHTVSAASHYEQAGNHAKAAALYDRAYIEGMSTQEVSSPARTLLLNEFSMKAGKYYDMTGEFERAAESFVRVRNHGMAAESYLKAGDRVRAAEQFSLAKDFERAGEMYIEAGLYPKATELFEHAGLYTLAGDSCMMEREYSQAAEFYVRGGDEAKAASAYKAAGDPARAAEMYMLLGDQGKATELIEESGDYMRAAELYSMMGDTDRENAALQKVTPDDPRHREVHPGDSRRGTQGLQHRALLRARVVLRGAGPAGRGAEHLPQGAARGLQVQGRRGAHKGMLRAGRQDGRGGCGRARG